MRVLAFFDTAAARVLNRGRQPTSSKFNLTTMRAIIRIISIAILISLSPAAREAYAQTASMNATAVEIALLPRFCWAQFGVPNTDGDEFRMQACGPGANHYCGALIYVIRAKHAANKSVRLDLLEHADGDTRYTERAIKDYPNCSIREHVAGTRAEVNNLIVLYGGKRPKAQ
jgi:hypothetical protein